MEVISKYIKTTHFRVGFQSNTSTYKFLLAFPHKRAYVNSLSFFTKLSYNKQALILV